MTDWNNIAHDMAAQTEAQLVAFFGTVENARNLAHLYVIEQHPLGVESERSPGGALTVRVSQTWRFRLKTDEELAAEQATSSEGSMMIRFPISTPMVSRSKALTGREVILIDGAQFEDDRRRIVVGQEVTDATITALKDALEQYERLDGMRRWFADLITDRADRGTE